MKKPTTSQAAKNPEAPTRRHRALFLRATVALLCTLFAQSGSALQIDTEACSAGARIETASVTPPRLVLIIDDIGHNLPRGRAAVDLPGKLNYAVLPYTPHGKYLADKAANSGKEVMLHTPMSNLAKTPAGRGALTPDLSKEEFRATLNAALDEFPQIAGINNHMGSELTQQRVPMSWVMQELRGRQLYFVDSRTSEKTVAANVATQFSVPNLSRHVFLDNDTSEQAIDARFQEVVQRAEKDGYAVAIGHPYPETVNYLQRALPTLEQRGIQLALVSEVLAQIEAPLHAPLADREIVAQLDTLLPIGCGMPDTTGASDKSAALEIRTPAAEEES